MRKMIGFTLLAFVGVMGLQISGCKKNLPPPKIDLAQVNEAFRATKGTTFKQWMQNFELAVNEIYLGNKFVSVDARRRTIGNLRIYGYIENKVKPGYQPGSDELIFRIVQKKRLMSGRFHYTLYDDSGWSYYNGYYNFGTRPFVTFLVIPTWHPYYTWGPRYRRLRRYRRGYRKSARFRRRRRRFKQFRKKSRARRRAHRRRSGRRSGGKR